MEILDGVWNEFMLWAKIEYRLNPEADIYDVFIRWRKELGNQPFSQNFLKNVDYEIAAEERRAQI